MAMKAASESFLVPTNANCNKDSKSSNKSSHEALALEELRAGLQNLAQILLLTSFIEDRMDRVDYLHDARAE